MPIVFEAVALGPTRRKRKNRVEPVQGLDRGLFIHAENSRMPGRIQIQTDDVSRFALEIRIVAGHVALQPMRFQTRFFPDPVHGILADAQFGAQLPAAPVRRAIFRFSARGRKDPRPQLRGEHRSRLPGMAGIQPIQARSQEPLHPADDGWGGGLQTALNPAERCPLGQHQDQTRTEHVSGRQ